MKQYQVLHHNEHGYKVVSTRSLEYGDYLMSGWTAIFEGNKKGCETHLEAIEEELLIC